MATPNAAALIWHPWLRINRLLRAMLGEGARGEEQDSAGGVVQLILTRGPTLGRSARTASLLAALTIMLTTCSSSPVNIDVPAGKSVQDVNRDQFECERDTRMAIGQRPTPMSHGQQWGWYAIGWDSQYNDQIGRASCRERV